MQIKLHNLHRNVDFGKSCANFAILFAYVSFFLYLCAVNDAKILGIVNIV